MHLIFQKFYFIHDVSIVEKQIIMNSNSSEDNDSDEGSIAFKRRKYNSFNDENEAVAIQEHIPHTTAHVVSSNYEDSSNDSVQEQPSLVNFNQSDWSASGPTADNNHFSESSSDDDESHGKSDTRQPYSSTSMRIMQKMGYVENSGLGRSGQGRLMPVQANAQQKGRRGLGLKLDGLEKAAQKWEPSMERTTLEEPVIWLENDYKETDIHELDCELLKTWVVKAKRKLTIDDETNFCNPLVLKNILKSKSIFDSLGADDMRRARTKSNPFETIRGNIFLNRAAVKMANLDYMFDFMFTNPVDEKNESLVKDDLLYFADVCAGPGGFTEYILWKKGWQAKGFGFTLKSENDFKLDDFYAGPPESFEPYYGINDDGNVFDPENIKSLTEHILRQTHQTGVHFMMADGGFSVEGQENVQEILSKQLYLCQCLVALNVVRNDGHFVVKLFDIFTRFSVGLIYFMYRCFKQICICKPNTSRPANSERYLVCKWKKTSTATIAKYLESINQLLWEYKDTNKDVLELVPLEVINIDQKFRDYIFNSNDDIGQNQIVGLLKIAAFAKDSNLHETRQAEIRLQCLRLWQLQDEIRRAPPMLSNDIYLNNILADWSREKHFMNAPEKFLMGSSNLEKVFDSYDSWYFIPFEVNEDAGKSIRTFFMSKGGRDVWRYNFNSSTWSPIRNLCLELSPMTLLYGEICPERSGEGRSQTLIYALHIIDAIMLGNCDVRRLPLTERNKMCQKFAKSLNKPMKKVKNCDTGNLELLMPIRCKRIFKISELSKFFTDLDEYTLKDGSIRLGFKLRNDVGNDRFFVPRGLMFMRDLRSDFLKKYSKSRQKFYYFNVLTNESKFFDDLCIDINASFKNTFTNRQVWKWEYLGQINQNVVENLAEHEHLLFRRTFEEFVEAINFTI